MISHNCIKCGQVYEDKDVDAYYCEACKKEKAILAKAIDAKVGSTVGQEPKSEFKALEALARAKGGFRGNDTNGGMFINVKDL
jgi:predicted  nucleic acid-binding Zn-ribbon protein